MFLLVAFAVCAAACAHASAPSRTPRFGSITDKGLVSDICEPVSNGSPGCVYNGKHYPEGCEGALVHPSTGWPDQATGESCRCCWFVDGVGITSMDPGWAQWEKRNKEKAASKSLSWYCDL
jgi:hypothetical protein